MQLSTFGRRLTGHVDELPGYVLAELEIRDAAVVTTGGTAQHPIAVPSEDSRDMVEGTVFEVFAAELTHADAYGVADYRRVQPG